MGSVYLAEDTKLHRKVAIKVLTPEWASDPERFRRFQWEAQALATLNHPNIVTIYSVEEEDDVHFLTMELVEGKTLAELIPSVGMPLGQIFEIAVPLADALAAAHERGIIHRDLKPGNIMVTPEGRVKILDFGLAKNLGNGDGADRGPAHRGHAHRGIADRDTATGELPLTREGQMLGTIPYMSPEQLRGDPVDHRTDLFSLGIILYEMCAGQRPFQGTGWNELASSILRDQPPSVTSFNLNLPRHLGRIVRHCLEKDPKRRFQTALDLHNELAELEREIHSGELPVTRDEISSAIRGPGSRGPGSRGPDSRGPDSRRPGSRGPDSRGPGRFRRPAFLRWELEKVLAIPATLLVIAAVAFLIWLRTGAPAPRGAGAGTEPAGWAAAGSPAPPPGVAAERSTQRIVVLPLENLGPAAQEYFAAGITEEITSRLSSVRALQVISRTTARNYDRAGKTLEEIGRELGVDYLIEGSVRWSTDASGLSRVRVTPQLIRVADDTHLWSESYDEVIDDIFAVQSTIAEDVIRQLAITLLEPEEEVLASRPTEDVEAYQFYLQAMDYGGRRDPTEENLRAAERLLEQSVELDPEFAEAWAELSELHSQMYHLLVDRTDERLAMARDAVDRALELDPELPEAHRALGYYYYWGRSDYRMALQEFDIAALRLPNDSQLIEGIAYIRRRQGRIEEAIAEFERALELDPQGAWVAAELGRTHMAARHYREAERYFDHAIHLAPNEPIPYQLKAENTLLWSGDTAQARAILEAMPGRREDYRAAMAWYRQHLLEGEYEEALEAIEATPMRIIADTAGSYPKTILRARVYDLLGREDDARISYQAARLVLERLVANHRPDDPRLRTVLGLAYAGLGLDEQAVREGRLAVELAPISEDALRGPAFLEQLAAIYARVGKADEALDLLEQLLAMPAEISAPLLRLDPRWRTLRDHPRFRKLTAEGSGG
jgi:serine/threonine-protein kinase